jgi:hypothetical protein
MKVLIVAKTRRGAGACVGAISQSGNSVRLIAHNAAHNERAGLEYEVGQVWEVESQPDPDIIPPHIENVIVYQAKLVRNTNKVTDTIARFMPPVTGGPEQLFDGRTRATSSGGLYICQDGGLPSRSTMFWIGDKPLRLDFEAKRIRYRYPTSDGGRTLTFVGFQERCRRLPPERCSGFHLLIGGARTTDRNRKCAVSCSYRAGSRSVATLEPNQFRLEP